MLVTVFEWKRDLAYELPVGGVYSGPDLLIKRNRNVVGLPFMVKSVDLPFVLIELQSNDPQESGVLILNTHDVEFRQISERFVRDFLTLKAHRAHQSTPEAVPTGVPPQPQTAAAKES